MAHTAKQITKIVDHHIRSLFFIYIYTTIRIARHRLHHAVHYVFGGPDRLWYAELVLGLENSRDRFTQCRFSNASQTLNMITMSKEEEGYVESKRKQDLGKHAITFFFLF